MSPRRDDPQLGRHDESKPQMLAQSAALFGHAQVFLLVRPRGFEHFGMTVTMPSEHWQASQR